MTWPAPTDKQARLLWTAASTLAVAILLAAAGFILWALGWLLNQLTAVLLPLALAGILAYLLDPVVDALHRRGLSRTRAIAWVFAVLTACAVLAVGLVVPRLAVETVQLASRVPDHAEQLRQTVSEWLAQSPLGLRAQATWESETGDRLRQWLAETAPAVGTWTVEWLGSLFTGLGLLIGLLLVPFYLYYFLHHKADIQARWTEYLPLQQSRLKEELVFVLTAINDALIVFCRGQVLVALCVGVLLTIGFAALGLPYAFLLGAVAAVLGIIPYLGAGITLVLALALATAHFRDWLHPVLVLALFGVVQAVEGFVLSPRIIGTRVGLHPVVVIIAVLVGTALLGGIVGGVLAIPLAAALRAILNRYVWKK